LKLLDDFQVSKVITPHFEQVIDRFIANGRFNNKSEVIRAGLRLLEEHELRLERATSSDLEQILDEDLADNTPPIPVEQLLKRKNR
jgi:antitoxin ParD1/3/4